VTKPIGEIASRVTVLRGAATMAVRMHGNCAVMEYWGPSNGRAKMGSDANPIGIKALLTKTPIWRQPQNTVKRISVRYPAWRRNLSQLLSPIPRTL